MSDLTYPADAMRAANTETFRKQAEIDRLRAQNEALREALCGARAWVEHSVAPIRPLSPAAAAPGEDMLREIDAALNFGVPA